MRKTFLALVFFLVAVVLAKGQQPAANPLPPAAQEVLERMEKEIAIAKTKASTSLDKILKDTTKKGDLQGALAIKSEIDRLQRSVRVASAAGPSSAFVGRWAGQGWTAESLADGTVVFSTGVRGRWRENGNSVRIECDNGDVHELERSGDAYADVITHGPGAGTKMTFRRPSGP